MASPNTYFSGLTRNTFLLAFGSFFADVSTEMLYPILPVFLLTLGAGPGAVGIIEGVAPALQNIMQGCSGWLSDKLKTYKLIAFIGYAVAAVAKPLIGLSTAWTGVLAGRSFDRLGAGMRSAPRDALVAASADDAHRGKAFGLEGFGDNLGAFAGPLVAIVLLTFLHLPLQSIFYLAVIPGTLAVFMILLVREKTVPVHAKATLDLNLMRFPKQYWKYIAVTALFGIGNSTNAFLIVRTQQLGVPLTLTVLIYAFFNLVAALASYPAGYLSDVFGRKGVLLLSFILSALVYGGFGVSTSIPLIIFLFIVYGVYQGIFRAVGKAMAADFVPEHLRASGIGWYSATIGLSGLVASVVGGELWTRMNPMATFLFGAVFAVLGSVALIVVIPGSDI